MAARFIKEQRSFIKSVLKDLNKKDVQLRRKAASHIKRKIAAKIKPIGTSQPNTPPSSQSGDLLAGLATRGGPWTAYVGFKKPGYHAVLLEFGGKSAQRTTTGGESRGHMAPRPVLFPTFAEETGAVKQILSEQRV